MDLDVTPALALGPGRPTMIIAEVVRELSEEDIEALADGVNSTVPTLQALKDSHHEVARLLASGERPLDVALITGYHPSRISILQRDPAFAELLAFYRERTVAEYDFRVGRMKLINEDALAEIQRRLDIEAERLKTSDVLKIATAMADRTGLGPTQKIEQKTLHLTLEDLEEIKRSTQEQQKGGVVIAQSHHTTPVGEADARPANEGLRAGEEEGPREPEERTCVPAGCGQVADAPGDEPPVEPVVPLRGRERPGVGRDGSPDSVLKVCSDNRVQANTDPLGLSPDGPAVRPAGGDGLPAPGVDLNGVQESTEESGAGEGASSPTE